MIIPKADLVALTGYTRASAQIRWLRKYGWRFAVNAFGEPIVAIAEFERQLVGRKRAPATQELNLEGINDSPTKPPKGKKP